MGDVTPETAFLYQNRQTGQPSRAPLTVRQLCRILCPAAGSKSTSIITPQTLLLGYNRTSKSYDAAGWRRASSVPLLREACGSWYYEGDGGVKGPVSTRTLSDLLKDERDRGEGLVDDTTRIYSAVSSGDDSNGSGAGEWTRIKDVVHLKVAMEVLAEVKSMPKSWPANDDGNMKQVANTTHDDGDDVPRKDNGTTQQEVSDELDKFLASTDHLAPHIAPGVADDGGESNEEEYESDGGTRYVRHSQTGKWLHEALVPRKEKAQKDDIMRPTSRKRKHKPKFSAKHARNWVYVTGLPNDCTEEEVAAYFSKVGIIDLDPATQKPKIKLYRHKEKGCGGGVLKGDASVCYARPESVALALQILDENLFRDGAVLSVQPAKFEQHGSFDNKTKKGGKRAVSEAKRKVARLAALQAVGWDEGENGRIAGGLKGLRIIVLLNMFDPAELRQDEGDEKLHSLEREVHAECEAVGAVEKITLFSNHPAGAIIVKFAQPNAASDAVNRFNGKERHGRMVEASYWDGVTDYTCQDLEKEEKETEKRLGEFGDWLEDQELPQEFKLNVEE